MAYTSGTAAHYKDLLAIMATFAAANGWVILEQSTTKVHLKGTGLSGLDEIYCGVETYEDAPNGRYNWNMYGSWGWRSGRAMGKHPRSSSMVCAYLWNAAIPYWMVCNGRRIIICAKIGTTYQQIYLGLLTPPATDAQYPYPLMIGGSGTVNANNYSNTIYAFWSWYQYSSSKLSFPGGTWGNNTTGGDNSLTPNWIIMSVNWAAADTTVTSPDGSYLLEPMYVVSNSYQTTLGVVEGLFKVTGFNNTAENIITVNGVNYMVFPDGSRSGYSDYCAMRLN